MIKQNKGEWSELYVFLKLLGDGVLYAADSDLNKIEDLYYPLIAVLREENQQRKKYEKSESLINIISDKGEQLLSLPTSEFQIKAELLLSAIKSADKTFAVPDIEKFMNIRLTAK
ncbi:MAG: HpaII family restriction endonuclease [bacterium]